MAERSLSPIEVVDAILDLPRMKGVDKAFLIQIARWYSAEHGYAWPTDDTLAERLGIAKRTVQDVRARVLQYVMEDGEPALIANTGAYRGNARKITYVPHPILRGREEKTTPRREAESASRDSSREAGIAPRTTSGEGETAPSVRVESPHIGVTDRGYSLDRSIDHLEQRFRDVLPMTAHPSAARQLAQASMQAHEGLGVVVDTDVWLEATRRAAEWERPEKPIGRWVPYVGKIVPQIVTEGLPPAVAPAEPSPYDRATVIV